MGEEKERKVEREKIWPEFGYVIGRMNEICERTIYLTGPKLRGLFIDQIITQGLGYQDFKSAENLANGKLPHYSDNMEGLQRHLREMDNRVYARKLFMQAIYLEQVSRHLLDIEDDAEKDFLSLAEIIGSPRINMRIRLPNEQAASYLRASVI